MDHDQILEMVKRVREELKGKQHKLDKNKNGKLDAQDFEHLRKMKEEPELEEAFPGKDYKSQMPDAAKTTTKTFHDVKKTSTGTVYTKQSDAEGMSKGTGEDAAKAAEPREKRGPGRPVGSKSGARQAGSSSKTDYRGFVDHTLNLPARK
jgi:hypothetical protein